MPLKRGLIQVYTGDGKGKTTAALGLAVRAAGQGLRTCIVQFMKGWPHYGELSALPALCRGLDTPHDAITIHQFGGAGFVDPVHPTPEDMQSAQEALAFARQAMRGGAYDIVILDEVNVAVDFQLVSLAEVLALCRDKPPQVELVLTGRRASAELIEIADLVTEMRAIKHPYDKGISGRAGIEY